MATKTFHRGLRDMKIAAWNAENSYGTMYDILGARNMSVTWTVETDQIEGDDVVLDRYSKIIAVQVSLEQAAVDLELLDMISGGSLVSNAAYEDLKLGEDDNLAYVAIAGRSVSSDAANDLHVFVPKCKIAGDLEFTMQYGEYTLPAAEFQGVNEGSTNGFIRFRKFSAATALEIPLRTSTGGL